MINGKKKLLKYEHLSLRLNSCPEFDRAANILPKSKRSTSIFNQLFNIKYLPDSKRSDSHLHFRYNYNLLKCKRAQGEVISTILLILLVIVASGILIAFVVPFATNILQESKCNDYNGKVYVTNNAKYTCYDNDAKRLLLQIKFDGTLDKNDAAAVRGIRILIETAGDSKTFDILPPSFNPLTSVVMHDGTLELELPEINEERTYNISDIYSRPNATFIYPILNGNQTCAGVAYTVNYIPFCN